MRSLCSGGTPGWARLMVLTVGSVLLFAPVLKAQEDSAPGDDAIHPIPVFTMGTGFITTFQGGTPNLGPLINPLLLVPVGQNWLIEGGAT